MPVSNFVLTPPRQVHNAMASGKIYFHCLILRPSVRVNEEYAYTMIRTSYTDPWTL